MGRFNKKMPICLGIDIKGDLDGTSDVTARLYIPSDINRDQGYDYLVAFYSKSQELDLEEMRSVIRRSITRSSLGCNVKYHEGNVTLENATESSFRTVIGFLINILVSIISHYYQVSNPNIRYIIRLPGNSDRQLEYYNTLRSLSSDIPTEIINHDRLDAKKLCCIIA